MEVVDVGRNTIWALIHCIFQSLLTLWTGYWQVIWMHLTKDWFQTSEYQHFSNTIIVMTILFKLLTLIHLLCPQLTNLNMANRMLNRESLTLNPRVRQTAAMTQGPVKAVHSGMDLLSCSRWVQRNDLYRVPWWPSGSGANQSIFFYLKLFFYVDHKI